MDGPTQFQEAIDLEAYTQNSKARTWRTREDEHLLRKKVGWLAKWQRRKGRILMTE